MPYGQNLNNLITLGNNTAHWVLKYGYLQYEGILILLFLLQKISGIIVPIYFSYFFPFFNKNIVLYCIG